MTAPDSLPLHALAEDNLAAASPDLLRTMVKTFADALMSAEAEALCNAEYGQVSEERVNHRNGYRPREWDTRAGTVELAIPKLRSGSYFPHWLLERRRRAEQALKRRAGAGIDYSSTLAWGSDGGQDGAQPLVLADDAVRDA
jgi:transposase-like protein